MNKVCILIAGLVLSVTAAAQESDRTDMWGFGLLLNNMSSESLSSSDGTSLDIDSSTGYGITLGYNFSERLALSGEFSWNSPDYDAVLILDDVANTPLEISHELDVYSLFLKGTFNFIEGPFTPYVEASFGWTEIDSNIQDSPPQTICWWDPWWGYICSTEYSTYSKTTESYGAAAGLRFDFSNGMSLKGS
ncbi:MAG: porin family protein [Proteobacteria bacterium]|nr:porin family protein [Pseudomonadota bacterium]MDA1062736.1 porin family protein [Pseudomonadota bacterium]